MRDRFVVVAMLRFIVLFALAAGSIYAGPIRSKTTFKKGLNFLYNYEFQFVFADPGYADLFGILNVESKAAFHAIEDDLVVLSLHNISIGPTQTKLNYPNPLLRMVTKELAPAVFNAKIEEIIKKLEIPIQFKHADGTILEVLKDTNEVPESLNIKRGLISLFEINVLGIHYADKSPKTVEPLSEPVYLEKTVQGLCRTKWLIPSVTENVKTIEIVKSINTDSCIVAPITQKGLISTYRGKSCEPRLKMVESSSTVRYVVSLKKDYYEVTKAIGESIYQVLLNSPTEGRITLSLNQTLTFVKISEKAAPKSEGKLSTGLIAEMPVHKKAPFPAEGVVEKIIALIQGDVQAKDVNDIILLAEYLDLGNLRTIWEKTSETKGDLVLTIFVKVDSPAMRKFLYDLLPTLSKTSWTAISAIALFQSPDEQLLFNLLNVLQTEKLTKDQRQHLILSIGAYANKFVTLLSKTLEELASGKKLVSEAIQHMHNYHEKKMDMQKIWKAEADAKNKLVVDITRSLEKVSEVLKNLFSVEPVHCLKAMGNMGWEMNVEYLHYIVKTASSPLSWRIVAIDSLRKMPWLSVKKILNPLLALYSDTKESAEIRTKVFLLLTKFELSEATIMELLLTHQRAAPGWIGTFVYKYLSSISDCHFWPMQNMSAKAKKVVSGLEPILPLYMKEKMSISNIYQEAHKIWQKVSSLLVWHFSWANEKSLSSSAVDLQVIPGFIANETSIILRIRSSSLATYDDVGVEIMIPHSVQKLFEIIKMKKWTELANTTISLKRNELELRILSIPTAIAVPHKLALIWNVNSRRIPTASGGFLYVDQKSTVVGRLPSSKSHLMVTSECHVNAYINGHFMHIGAGMRTAVKLHVPVKLHAELAAEKVILKAIWKPMEKTTKMITIEQVPYTILRQFLPKYLKGGELVVIQEVPLVISKKATDVNYIEVTENLALYAQLPVTVTHPQDIITSVWYGIHSINLAFKDEKMTEQTLLIECGGRVVKQAANVYTLLTEVKLNEWISKQNTTVSVIPENNNLIWKLNMIVKAAGKEHLFGADISTPWLKPLPAKCLFTEIYQNITRSLLHKADISQPCLIKSQVEKITSKYIHIWKKLTSYGILDIDEAQHNIIAELVPESISGSIKASYVDDFRKQVEVLKIVQDFNQAAFQPLIWEDPKMAKKLVHNALLEAKAIIEKQTSLHPSADPTYATWYQAVVYEMIAIYRISETIYMEAVEKISGLYPSESESLKELSSLELYGKLVKEFNKNFDSQIEKKIVKIDDRSLFKKIQEVEQLIISGVAEPLLIQKKTNELLTLLPSRFNTENLITETLFLRAHHLVSHSITFQPPVTGVTLYEFWHLKQDIIMYFSLKKESIEVLPTEKTLMCQLHNLITEEFKLFHKALSYKRIALKDFLSNDKVLVNELMLEFDDLLRKIELIVAITSEIRIEENPSIEIVKTLYRMVIASEWSLKLLEENKSIWMNIKHFGVSDRANRLNKLKRNIIILWNKLKISESCKSGIIPLPTPLPKNITYQECAIPESLSIIARITVNSTLWFKAQVTAKKSLEQLIHEHDQSIPGFRAETTFRYLNKLLLSSNLTHVESPILPAIKVLLQKLGLNWSGIPEEWKIISHINSFNDIQIASLIKPSPIVQNLLSSPVWTKVIRLLRWPLLKYWQVQDWKQILRKPTSEMIPLPTIRIVKYMDKMMADILIVRPTVTESFLEVPVITVPLMHLPKWIAAVPAVTPVKPAPVVPAPVVPSHVVPSVAPHVMPKVVKKPVVISETKVEIVA